VPEVEKHIDDRRCHPALLLEKWHPLWPEKPKSQDDRKKAEFDEFARAQLKNVTEAHGDPELFRQVSCRRASVLDSLGATRWTCKTAGPLTLHLSVSGSFENAGICLHPLYGFAYLPGTSIKGLARAYATSLASASAEDILRVFGPDEITSETARAGEVVFYEAWPKSWPRLVVDIVNNHHREYYNALDDTPPVDWEDPNPVYFLAVPPGTDFEFAIRLRRNSNADGERLLSLAQAWVGGALAWLGAGAKTNAGYGRFLMKTPLPAPAPCKVFECVLELVSPAFLAGGLQTPEECNLRSATVRGLLRWWWRAIHAGTMPVQVLRRLEGQLWGTTSRAGALAVEVLPSQQPSRGQFDIHRLVKDFNLPTVAAREKATQGILFLGYGMQRVKEDLKKGRPEKPARYYVCPPAYWTVRLVAKDIKDAVASENNPFNAQQALRQGIAALAALSYCGGLGARCRRGWGSFDLKAEDLPQSIDEILEYANLTTSGETTKRRLETSSVWLGLLAGGSVHEYTLPGDEVWYALDSLGTAYRYVMAQWKHEAKKARLGLPRQGLSHPLCKNRSRHASPLHFRLFKDGNEYKVRVTAFVDPKLPDTSRSKATVDEFLALFEAQLKKVQADREGPQAPKANQETPRRSTKEVALKVGQTAYGLLLEDRTKKGGWRIQEESTGERGPIQNSDEVPPDLRPGDRIKVLVKIAKAGECAFKYVGEA